MARRRRPSRAWNHGLDILAPARDQDTTPLTETTAVDLLSTPATGNDLSAALASRPPRAKLPSVTLALVAAALLGAGFLGGVLLQKHESSSSGGGIASALASGGLPSLGGSGGPAGLGGGGLPSLGGSGGSSTGSTGGGPGLSLGGATIGTVKLIDGKTIYVQSFTGTITKVTTTSATKIQISAAGTLKNLRPGETLMIRGTKHGGGAVTATSVSESGGLGG